MRRDDFLAFGSSMIEQSETDEAVVFMRSGWLETGPKLHNSNRRSKV